MKKLQNQNLLAMGCAALTLLFAGSSLALAKGTPAGGAGGLSPAPSNFVPRPLDSGSELILNYYTHGGRDAIIAQ